MIQGQKVKLTKQNQKPQEGPGVYKTEVAQQISGENETINK